MSYHNNIIPNLQQREVTGVNCSAFNREFIYSRFRPVRQFGDRYGFCEFTTCRFAQKTSKILIGTRSGVLKVFNIMTGQEDLKFRCHSRGVVNIETNQDSSLVITSNGRRVGCSSLWNFGEKFELLYSFLGFRYMEFAKQNSNRLIGTKHDAACLFDTATFQQIQTFRSEEGNGYRPNIATMSYCDELILSDGVLYDIRSGNMLHRLDKQNSIYNGAFHPNGREIILNSAIWDLRKPGIVQIVPMLDQCQVSFNLPVGSIIYGVVPRKDELTATKVSCFYTFDAYDYTHIATVDVKLPVFQVTADFNERFVATIEYRGVISENPYPIPYRSVLSVCKLYEIGISLTEEENVQKEDDIRFGDLPPPEYVDMIENETNEITDSETDEESTTSEEDESDEEDNDGPPGKLPRLEIEPSSNEE